MDENYSFGYWVRRRRKALGLTEDALARRVSCALTTIRKIEADERLPSRETIERLAEVLEVPAAERDTFRKAGRGAHGVDRLAGVPFAKATPPAPTEEPAALPAGTVTFLLSDIEGSTLLWEQDAGAAHAILEHYDLIVERIVSAHGGVVVRVRGEGDSHFAVFRQAAGAVAAAVDVQRALQTGPWPAGARLRVRMALHTGEAAQRAGDYYGTAVNRCARLRGAAHGGQTVLSSVTEGLVRDRLPPGARLQALGIYHLRDIATPERIFQLVVPDLPADFPPLRAQSARRHTLPEWSTPLIDREVETAAAREQLLHPAVRLLVMTGPGGAGKTRLALRTAATMADTFEDGVVFVSLAAIADPDLVPSAIAQALELKESGEQPLLLSIKEYLAGQHLLLVLDNFEQVLGAAPLLGELLRAASRLKILVTSRAVLGVSGEHELPVPPLALPRLDPLPSPAAMTGVPAVALFLQRAQAALPAFQLTAHNAAAIAEICVRLDGLPLALELAAARTRLLPPRVLLERLTQGGPGRLPLLVGGARDLPARQRTLRDTIAWSYDLLNLDEQVLFTRLSVFVGGWSLEAAEAVVTPSEPASILDGLQLLLDQSLILRDDQSDDHPRFKMFETIRAYAAEKLAAAGDGTALHRRHAAFFLALAEAAEPELHGPEASARLAQLARDYDNLRAVLQWAVEQNESETAARLAAALWPFWYARSFWSEGRRWLAAVLGMGSALPATLRTSLLNAAGVLAAEQGRLDEAQAYIEQCLALRREAGDTRGIGSALVALGNMAQMQGDHARAADLYEQSLHIFRAVGHAPGIASVLNNLGIVALGAGDAGRAMALHEQSLAILRELGDPQGIASALSNLARVAFDRQDYARVQALATESLGLWAELGNAAGIAECLEALAGAACAGPVSEPRRAARLWGAAEQIRAEIDAPLSPVDRPQYERLVAAARECDDAAGFAMAWAEGRGLTLEQAIAYAQEHPAAV